MMKCLAMDFGGSSIKYAVVNEQGGTGANRKRPGSFGVGEEFVDSVEKLYLQYRDELAASH